MTLQAQVATMNRHWRRRARRYLAGSYTTALGLLGLVGFGTARYGWSVLAGAVVSAAGVLAVGGAALESIVLVRRGLLVAPAHPTAARLQDDLLIVTDGTDQVQVPVADIRAATFVFHDSFDGIRGIDDALRIHLSNCEDLLVSSSAQGFGDLLSWLERERSIARQAL